MNVDQIVFRFAGFLVITGVGLGYFHHIAWLGIPTFVGLNMLQASFTGFCPLAKILKRFGVEPGPAFT